MTQRRQNYNRMLHKNWRIIIVLKVVKMLSEIKIIQITQKIIINLQSNAMQCKKWRKNIN